MIPWMAIACLVLGDVVASPLQNSGMSSRVRAVRQQLIDAVTVPMPPERVDALLERVAKIDEELQSGIQKLNEDIRVESALLQDATRRESIAKLSRQRSRDGLIRVELAVLRSELFAAGTADAASMATAAAQIAESVLTTLPAAGVVRSEVLRLLAEAQLRRGDPQSAMATLKLHLATEVTKSDAEPDLRRAPSDRLRALRIRIAIAQDDLEFAQRLLQERPTGPESVAMDLAQLELRMARSGLDAPSVSDWMDEIGRRHGVAAQTRAETLVARRRENDFRSDTSRNVRLRIADGVFLFRIGQNERAAVALAQAAALDKDPMQALDSATRSSAILVQSGRADAAIELLSAISKKHSHVEASADAMLRLVAIADHSTSPSDIDRIESLSWIVDVWPESRAALTARDALIRIATAEKRFLDAAILACRTPERRLDEDAQDRAVRQWMLVLTEQDEPPDSIASVVNQIEPPDLESFMQSMKGSVRSEAGPNSKRLHDRLASWLADSAARGASTWEQSDVSKWNHLIAWRLQRDARRQPTAQRKLADTLLQMVESPSPLDVLRWKLWAGREVKVDTSDPIRLATAAAALSTSNRSSDQSRASGWWKQLASGLPQSSDDWQRVRWQGIATAYRGGDREGARADAARWLLTHPPDDQDLAVKLRQLSDS
ncbi:MAG: hypothetical protein AAGJ40_14520 [Planctomycetota bacterium]